MSQESQQSQEHILSARQNHKNTERKKLANLPNTTDLFLDQLLQTVTELEQFLIADHQQDYKLRMAFEQQTERVYDLHACLSNEKLRNQRLVDLILNVDSCPSEDGENVDDLKLSGRDVINRWSLNSRKEVYESISPLLMQQRYEELSSSYNLCRKQLIKKERQLTLHKCEKEMLQSQYDHLMEEFRRTQKRFEGICIQYLRMQKKKNYEIQHLKESLTYASDCIITAQQVLESSARSKHLDYHNQEFQQNLQLFINTLQLCEWPQCQCCNISNRTN